MPSSRVPARCDHDQDNREFRDGTFRCMVCGSILPQPVAEVED